MEQLNQSGSARDNKGSLTPMTSFPSQSQKEMSEAPLCAIAECQAKNKKTTSQDKSCSCGNNSQMRKLYKTSEADSTSKEKELKPFYNDLCKDISSLLLSHTEIDCADSVSNSSNSCLNKMVEKSWFSTTNKFHHNKNSQKICSQYYMYSLADYTDLEDTKIKSKKIRIYPTLKQRTLFKQWIGVSRVFYNKAIENYNLGKEDENKITNWMALGTKLIGEMTEDYIKCVPYQIRKMAVHEAYNSWKINCKKFKKSNKPFKLKFRSKRFPEQSCCIPKSAIKELGIYYTISGKLNYSERDWFEENVHDGTLEYDNGRWFICFGVDVKDVVNENQVDDIVALDPGVRAFMTYFSTNGHFGQIGHGSFNRLQRLAFHCDKLYSAISLEKNKLRKNSLRRAVKRTKHKITDLVDELHWKTIDFLIHNFKTIFLPTFDVSQMVSKFHRKLRSKTVRNMLSYRFYIFKKRLITKCKLHKVRLIICDESYTSKTNSFNGEIFNVGSKEWFMYDGIKVNRDVNGARNILIKSLSLALRDSSVIG